jgi:hypothetical protein
VLGLHCDDDSLAPAEVRVDEVPLALRPEAAADAALREVQADAISA